jgi:ribonuclease Z
MVRKKVHYYITMGYNHPMKPSFHHRLVNNPFEDPLLYIRLLWQGRAILFDAGTISRLSPGAVLKVSDVFVSHTHIDHFIGFDAILRTLLRRQAPLRVYGPDNIIGCVEGKLRGYTWNLIREYPLKLEVFGIGGGILRQSSFYAENGFDRIDREPAPFDGTVLREPGFRVRAASLGHDIQCLGYCIEEDFHINIDKSALEKRGLPVGPWLSTLKAAIRENLPEETELEVSGRPHTLADLRDIAMITRGQKVTYVVDAAPEEENIEKIIGLAQGSDTLYCEAYFLEADRDRARERNHLTAKLAGQIARRSDVKDLVVMHFSPKYRSTPAALEKEAREEFTGHSEAQARAAG